MGCGFLHNSLKSIPNLQSHDSTVRFLKRVLTKSTLVAKWFFGWRKKNHFNLANGFSIWARARQLPKLIKARKKVETTFCLSWSIWKCFVGSYSINLQELTTKWGKTTIKSSLILCYTFLQLTPPFLSVPLFHCSTFFECRLQRAKALPLQQNYL